MYDTSMMPCSHAERMYRGSGLVGVYYVRLMRCYRFQDQTATQTQNFRPVPTPKTNRSCIMMVSDCENLSLAKASLHFMGGFLQNSWYNRSSLGLHVFRDPEASVERNATILRWELPV